MKDRDLRYWTTWPNVFYVAENTSGKVLGSIAYQEKSKTTVEMNRLSVDVNFQGLKIGQKLMDFLITEAKLNGYKSMYLETSEYSEAAIKLYQNLDFNLVKKYVPDSHFIYKISGNYILCFEKIL